MKFVQSSKPSEDVARSWLAAMYGVSPDRIVNVDVLPDGNGGWTFAGNVKIDKPRRFGRITKE